MKIIPFLVTLLFASTLQAVEPPAVPVKIEHAWIRAVPPGSAATAAYMTLTNTGNVPIRVTSAESPIAPMVHPMVMTDKSVDGRTVKGMEIVESFEIPAGGTRELKPGGDHIMLMEMKEPPAEGTSVKLKLHFQPGDHEVEIEVPVARTAPE